MRIILTGLIVVLLAAGCGGGGTTTGNTTATETSTSTTSTTAPTTTAPTTTAPTTTAPTTEAPLAIPTLGQALLSWSPPLQNTDGSMLTDLTGFDIYYGKDPANLSFVEQIDWSLGDWHIFYNLDPGTWYFTVRAYNSAGVESNLSQMVSKTIS